MPFLMDKALLSISPAGCGQLVKMLITLDPHAIGIFGSGFDDYHFGQSRSFSEKAHNSLTTWYFLLKFCLRKHFNLVLTLV